MVIPFLSLLFSYALYSVSVRLVTSEKPGMGKSLHVSKLAKQLKSNEKHCIVPIHGPKVNFDSVVQSLNPFVPKSYQSAFYQIIHLDIDSEVPNNDIVDDFF